MNVRSGKLRPIRALRCALVDAVALQLLHCVKTATNPTTGHAFTPATWGVRQNVRSQGAYVTGNHHCAKTFTIHSRRHVVPQSLMTSTTTSFQTGSTINMNTLISIPAHLSQSELLPPLQPPALYSYPTTSAAYLPLQMPDTCPLLI